MDAKAQELQYNIDNDIPTSVKLGKKTFKVRDLKSWTGSKLSVLIAKKNQLLGEENTVDTLKAVNNLSSKVLSISILGSKWRVLFLHWFFWRYIRDNFTEKEIGEALTQIVDKLQLGFFLQNIVLIESLNQLRIHLTKEEALSYQAEQLSGKKRTS